MAHLTRATNPDNRLTCTLAVLILVGTSLPALADTTLSGGVSIFGSPYKGANNEAGIFINLNHKSGRTTIDERGLTYQVSPQDWDKLNVGITLTSAGLGHDAEDATSTKGMKDRDMSLDAGISLEYVEGDCVFSTTMTHDITNTHGGDMLDVHFRHTLKLNEAFTVTPRVGAIYTSKDYNQYYFGVETSEQTATRAAYQAKGSLSGYAGYQAHYALGDHWGIVHSLTVASLGDEITDSSIVDDNPVWLTTAGVSYTF